MPRTRRRYNREKTHNYSWGVLDQVVSSPSSSGIYLLHTTEKQNWETLVQRQRGIAYQRSGGDEVGLVIASAVLPADMTSADEGREITESNFPDPLDDNTDDWSLWTPMFFGSDQGSPQATWDSKAKRRIAKDEQLYTVAKMDFQIGASISMGFLGRVLQSWRA